MEVPRYHCVTVNGRELMHLSDEVLVLIFRNLPAEDLISLSRTCSRLNRVICERKIVRELRLKTPYTLTPSALRLFFRPTLRCQNVETLSLTGCYWLTSGEILYVVLRLPNLRCLYVHDTALSLNHLTQIFKANRMIKRLAWTFHIPKKLPNFESVNELGSYMKSVEYLSIWSKGLGVWYLTVLLKHCENLEDLRISAFTSLVTEWSGFNSVSFHLPHLRSLVIKEYSNTYGLLWNFISSKLLESCHVDAWHNLWIDTQNMNRKGGQWFISPSSLQNVHAVAKNLSERQVETCLGSRALRYLTCPYSNVGLDLQNSQVTHLVWASGNFITALPPCLEHLHVLCLSTKNLHPLDMSLFGPLLHLTRLSVPFCTFLIGEKIDFSDDESENSSNERTNTILPSGRARVSHVKRHQVTNCLLKRFTEIAPNLKELEIRCDYECNTRGPMGDVASTRYITRWRQLESLFLENLFVVGFPFFIEIARSCPKLKRLSIKNVDNFLQLSSFQKLITAIGHLHELKDFRFEDRHVGNMTHLYNALAKCPKLQRVAILFDTTTTDLPATFYMDFIEKCSDLVFLYLHSQSYTGQMIKNFKRLFKKKYTKEKPMLWAQIVGEDNYGALEACPIVHRVEMLNTPHLAIVPPAEE